MSLALLPLVSQALAGPSVDMLVVPISAHTRAVAVAEERIDVLGFTNAQPQHGREVGLGNRGLLVEVGGPLRGLHPTGWVVSTGLTQARTRYRFETFTFSPTSIDSHLTVGLFPWFSYRRVPEVDGYAIALLGVHGSILSARPLVGTYVAFAPRMSLGFGMGTRTLPARLRVEVRADLVPHFGTGNGRAELPNSAVTWTWWPGSAAMSVLVGGGFGARERATESLPAEPEG